jgi:hypothetical protein
MTSKERIAAAFEKKETDRVPIYHNSVSSDVATQLLGHEAYVGFGIQQWREAGAHWQGADAHAEFVERTFADTLAINRLYANDLMRFLYPRYNVKPTKKIDEHTFLYEYGEEDNWKIMRYDPSQEHYSVIYDYKPKPVLTFEGIEKMLDARERALEKPAKPRAFSEDDMSVRAFKQLGDEYVIRQSGGGVSIPRDEIWLEAVALRLDLVARHLDLQVESTRRSVGAVVDFGFEYLFGGGDFAGYHGPFYSPKAFHELVWPRLQQVADIIHEKGGNLLFASDGDLWSVADDLFGSSGVDGFYEIDRLANMDLPRLRETFPYLTLVGNISSHTLHVGTKEEVIEETLSCLEDAKKYRGIVVGISNLPVPGTPLENIEAMLETISAHR